MVLRVYLDVLFCVNLFVDYFLLLGVRRFFRLGVGRLRILGGAAAGAAGGCGLFFLRAGKLLSFFGNLSLAAAVVAASFCPLRARKWFGCFAAFYLMNFAYAGLMLAVYTFVSPGAVSVRNGIVYFPLSPLWLFALTVGAYLIVSLITRLCSRRSGAERYCELLLDYGGREYRFRAKVDTGCSLREPFSGRFVAILGEGGKSLREQIPAEALRVIPYRDLSGEGLLEGFCPPAVQIRVQGKTSARADCCLAFFPGRFGEGDWEALVPPELIEERKE